MGPNDDRKMFAPLRAREATSPEAKLFVILSQQETGTIAADLADRLVKAGLAVGTRRLVTQRIGEMLDGLEEAGKAERTPDGRYRAVRLDKRGRRDAS
jgi:hypothetical protein